MVNGNAVVEPQRRAGRAAERKVQAQADAPVVAVTGKIVGVRAGHHVADIVKRREPQAFDDGDAVFNRAKPVGVAADGFVRSGAGFARTDVVKLKAAQRIQPAEIPPLIEGDLFGGAVRFRHARAAEDFQNVAGGESFEVPVRFEFEAVIIFLAAKGSGQFGGEGGLLAFIRQKTRAARVPGDGRIQFGNQCVAAFSRERIRNIDRTGGRIRWRCPGWQGRLRHRIVVKFDAHLLQRVADAADEKVAAQRASHAEAAADQGFAEEIVRAEVIQFAVVEVDVEVQLPLQKPRLDELGFKVFALRAVLDAQAEFLAGPGEGGRMEQIEVALVHLGVTDEGIHRAEARADGHVAGLFFLDTHDEVFPVGHVGRLGTCIHLAEVIQAFDAHLAVVDAHHVEHVAGRDGQFSADDAILGFDVAANLNFLDEGFLALVNFEFQIHRAAFRVGHLVDDQIARAGGDVNVAFGPVKILDCGGVLGQAVRGEGVAEIHLQAVRPELDFFQGVAGMRQAVGLRDVGGAEQNIPGVFDGAHFVLAAFKHIEPHDHRLRRGMRQFHLLDFKINVALLVVELGQLFLVIVKLVLLEAAAAGEPGEHPVAAGFEEAAEFAFGKSLRPDELHVDDFYLDAFGDGNRGGAASGLLINAGDVGDLGAGVA